MIGSDKNDNMYISNTKKGKSILIFKSLANDKYNLMLYRLDESGKIKSKDVCFTQFTRKIKYDVEFSVAHIKLKSWKELDEISNEAYQWACNKNYVTRAKSSCSSIE